MALIRRDFFARSVHAVAPDLIGATLSVQRRRRPHRRGRGLSPHRSRSAQLRRPHRAQRCHVRPARLRLRLSLIRHPLVRELRVRAGRQRQRGADPGDRADWKGWTRCAAGAGSGTSACCAPAPAGCARRSASPGRTTDCRSMPPPFELRRRTGNGRDRGRPAHRHHQGGRPAVALRPRGLALPEQAVQARQRNAGLKPRSRCAFSLVTAPSGSATL